MQWKTLDNDLGEVYNSFTRFADYSVSHAVRESGSDVIYIHIIIIIILTAAVLRLNGVFYKAHTRIEFHIY